MQNEVAQKNLPFIKEKQASKIREFIIVNHREGKLDWQNYTFEDCIDAWYGFVCFPEFMKLHFIKEIKEKKRIMKQKRR